MDYTVSGIIDRVKRIAAIPPSQPGFSKPELIAILNDELFGTIVPWLMSFDNENLVTYRDDAITSTSEFFNIPAAAVGSSLREVKAVKVQGGLECDDSYIDLPLYTVADAQYAGRGVVIRGDKVQLRRPSDYTGYYLRQYYFRRPNELIDDANCRAITVINTGTDTVTLANVPTAWTADGYTFDIIQGSSPFKILSEAVTGTVNGADIAFAALPTGLVVGDWIAPSGKAPVPVGLPFDAYSLFAQAAALRVLESLGDSKGQAASIQKFNDLANRLAGVLENRISGEPKKVLPRFSPMDY